MKYGCIVFFVALSIGSLTACSSPSSKSDSGSVAKNAVPNEDAEKGLVCTYESPVGSLIRHKKCSTPLERDEIQRQLEEIQKTPSATGTR